MVAIVIVTIEEYCEEVEQEIEIEAKVRVWRENYGEDADGNRGVMTTFSELDEITILDEKNTDITNMFEGDFKDQFKKYVEQLEEQASEEW